jgi:hypothetical protein
LAFPQPIPNLHDYDLRLPELRLQPLDLRLQLSSALLFSLQGQL